VVEHHAKIAAIDPAAACLAFDEVLGFVGRRVDRFADIFFARDIGHSSRFSLRRPQCFTFEGCITDFAGYGVRLTFGPL
jgi:hypothetical protein